MSSSLVNSPLDIHFKRFTPCVIIYSCDKWLSQHSSPSMALVVTDASIKNNIATSISHIHSANQPFIKTVHYAAFITSMEAELFAIRCSINQACIKENVSKIIIVTDSIHATKKIFDSKLHPYQSHCQE